MSLFQSANNSDSSPQGSPPRRRLDARLCALALIAATASCFFAATRAPSVTSVAASGAQTPARIRAQPGGRRSPRRPAIDYSNFSHSSAKHLSRDCAACHRIESFERPDINDYPDHPSCVECHRPQFFRGARPVICSNCHTVVAPRGEARHEFPREGRPAEFADVFPHSNHVKATSLIQFKRILGDKATTTATCQYCHKVDTRDFRKQPGARPADFAPEPGTFMTTPTSHATCFQCHWRDDVDGREQAPLASNCAGCHRNQAVALKPPPSAAVAATTPRPTSNSRANTNSRPAAVAAVPRVVPASASRLLSAQSRSWPPRVSPKFAHEIEPHKKRTNDEGKEVPITCLQCHASARKATTLEIFRLRENRVQLLTCASTACHTAVSGTAQLRLSVFRELRERGKDAKFDCALCHSPPVSTAAEVPCGHYAAVYASAVKEKKNTKGIEAATPERCREVVK